MEPVRVVLVYLNPLSSRGARQLEAVGRRGTRRGDTCPGRTFPGADLWVHVSVDLFLPRGSRWHSRPDGHGGTGTRPRVRSATAPPARSARSRGLPAWRGPRESAVQIPRRRRGDQQLQAKLPRGKRERILVDHIPPPCLFA